MAEGGYFELLEQLMQGLPTFPDGRVDYTHASAAPVVNAALYRGDEVLLLKRSPNSMAYPNKWNGVSGFIDRPQEPREVLLEELLEETGLIEPHLENISVNEPYEVDDELVGKRWHVFPVRVDVKDDAVISLNDEHTDQQWVKITEVDSYDILPDFKKVMRHTSL